jgi:tudor domain-containing protein 2
MASASSNDVPNSASAQPSTVSFVQNGIIEVYVSCVYHPNMFWIQQVGQESIELDKLGDIMTDFYHREYPRDSDEPETDFAVGDIVAAPFQLDDKMYRAKIVKDLGDGSVEIEYVDYGDRRTVALNQLRIISPGFLGLKFQAVEASLNLGSDGEVWSDDAINTFCDLSYCAQWRAVTAKVKGFLNDDQGNKNRVVWLELMDRDVNIGQSLINQGFAKPKDEFSHKNMDGSHSNNSSAASSSSSSSRRKSKEST